MKKLILTLTFAIIATQCLLAQNATLASTTTDSTLKFKNYIFAEIGGSTLSISVNYERFLSKSPGGFSVRAGLGFGVVPGGLFGNGDQFYLSIPLSISYNLPISKNKHNFFELGGSYTFVRGSDTRTTHNFSFFGTNITYSSGYDLRNAGTIGAIMGWRHSSASGKTQIRLYLMPVRTNIVDNLNNGPIVGFSIGRRF